ncbi:MAG: glycosyltransferase family 4 protein [Candidatus Moranbacteria bacterium]|nr:glycosyltransferase family 4 protein [Candidatus Moranbacteria bacterium]
MRVAIFTNNYLPNPYGVAGSIESFRKEFEKLGHNVYIFAPETKGYVNENPHVFFYSALNLRFKNIKFPIAIPYSYRVDRILEKLEIDVVHCQHPNLLGSAGKKWAQKKNVPLVFTWHTLYDKYAHFVPLIPSSWAAKWAIGNAVGFANDCDQIVVPTQGVKNIIEAWGVINENIVAIPTGVQESLVATDGREKARHEYEITDDEIVITLVCRITPEKNVLFLANAMKNILQKNEKAIFVLAGDGSDLAEVKKMLTNDKIGQRFRFFGIVNSEEKSRIYAMSDIFVYASKSETQGMVLTEAMSAGLPIVAVEATGAKDLVENGQTGFLVEENETAFVNAVQKLIDGENLRKSFGENARKIAMEKYTSQACAAKMLAVYEEVVKRRKQLNPHLS